MPELHCPHCDRRLTPEHRCLSRRVFLGALFGALVGSKAVQAQAEKTGLVITGIDWKTKTITMGTQLMRVVVSDNVPKNQVWMMSEKDWGKLIRGPEVKIPPPSVRIVNLKEPG